MMEFSQPTKQARFWAEPGFLVNLGMRLIWIGRRNGWAYRNDGLCIPVSSFKSHRTTNRDFKIRCPKGKIDFILGEKGHFFSKARK